jgi:hypothetical protein
MPQLAGRPIQVRFLPQLRARAGGLHSGGSRGEEVYAGSFLRKREIVFDAALLTCAREFARIFVHELFHFVWLRAGNSLRQSYEALLSSEIQRGARGELGWSAQSRKQRLTPTDAPGQTRHWREYACESFCDTAAWVFAGLREHEEFTLAPRFRTARRAWFLRAFGKPEISI